jgi:hypothetical protein
MMHLLWIPRDTLRLIVLELSYESIPSLLRISRVARLIVKEPVFWKDKALHDFSNCTEEKFRSKNGPTNRIRYLRCYRARTIDPLDPIARDKDAILQLYITQQLRERFSQPGSRLPMNHYWNKYGETKILLKPNGEGYPCFTYINTSGETITTYYPGENRVLDVRMALLTIEPSTVEELFCIFNQMILVESSQQEPIELPARETIEADDIIYFDKPSFNIYTGYPAEDVNAYFVYVNEKGQLGLQLCYEGILPVAAMNMLKRRGVRTRLDMYELYDAHPWDLIYQREVVINEDNPFIRIAKNEIEYHQRKEHYYHESNAIEK